MPTIMSNKAPNAIASTLREAFGSAMGFLGLSAGARTGTVPRMAARARGMWRGTTGFGDWAGGEARRFGGWIGAKDFTGRGWTRAGAVGARAGAMGAGAIGTGAALDFLNPFGLGWGD